MTQLQIIRGDDGNLYRVSNENKVQLEGSASLRRTTMHAMDDVI